LENSSGVAWVSIPSWEANPLVDDFSKRTDGSRIVRKCRYATNSTLFSIASEAPIYQKRSAIEFVGRAGCSPSCSNGRAVSLDSTGAVLGRMLLQTKCSITASAWKTTADWKVSGTTWQTQTLECAVLTFKLVSEASGIYCRSDQSLEGPKIPNRSECFPIPVLP